MLADDEKLRRQRGRDHRRFLAFDFRNADRAHQPVELARGHPDLPGKAREASALGLRADQADEFKSLALQRRRGDVEIDRVRVRHDYDESVARRSRQLARRMLAVDGHHIARHMLRELIRP